MESKDVSNDQTHQKQTPTSRHESKDANYHILQRHAWPCNKRGQYGNKCQENQTLDEPKHKLEICTEFSTSHGDGLQKRARVSQPKNSFKERNNLSTLS